MDKTRLVYGIDLGTTYSCVAQVDKFDQAVVLRNFEGDTTTPSVVHIDGDHVVVGKEAKQLSAEEPEKTIAFIKRKIGDDASFDKLKGTGIPGNYDPVEVSALILKKLVQDANAAAGLPEEVKDVVITCPAYFGTKERLQTKQAGEAAGLNVLAIINEPTAAAIAYGMKVTEKKFVLVYDLGGGTFDVTAIRVEGGTIRVIATGGDHKLGGKDWDEILAGYLLLQYNQEHGTNLTLDSDERLTNALLLEAEAKKKALTARPAVNAVVNHNGVSSRVEITRDLFDALTEAQLQETIDKTAEVLEIAKKQGFTQIDEVLLVGGSSRMPQIKERVDKEFGFDAKLHEPDECVAKGAAIYALNESFANAWKGYEEGEVDEAPKFLEGSTRTRIINVTSKTYGTDASQKVRNLIFANTALPVKSVETFYTGAENQKKVPMKVFESDVTDPEEDAIIEENAAVMLEDRYLELKGNYPAETPVLVTFEIDSEGMLSVHAAVGNEVLEFQLRISGVRDGKELAQTAAKLAQLTVG